MYTVTASNMSMSADVLIVRWSRLQAFRLPAWMAGALAAELTELADGYDDALRASLEAEKRALDTAADRQAFRWPTHQVGRFHDTPVVVDVSLNPRGVTLGMYQGTGPTYGEAILWGRLFIPIRAVPGFAERLVRAARENIEARSKHARSKH
jgi:hypothetical protein